MIYGFLTGTCLANQAYVLYFLNTGQYIQNDDFVALTVTLINSILFVYVLMLMWDELRGQSWFKIKPIKTVKNPKKRVKENGTQ
jgi:hypothetical protein